MANNITPTSLNMGQGGFGIEPLRGGRLSELIKLQGASTAVNDTSTAYTFKTIKKPGYVEGGAFFLSSISGNTAIFNSLVALGSNAVVVRVYEDMP